MTFVPGHRVTARSKIIGCNPVRLLLSVFQEVVVVWLTNRVARVPVTVAGRLTSIGLGVISLTHGILTIVGGDDRWQGPAFVILREAPGGPYISGLICVGCGLAILVGTGLPSWAVRAWALLALSCWAFVYALGLLEAAHLDHHVSITAGALYLWFSYQCVVVISVDERVGKVVTRPPADRGAR